MLMGIAVRLVKLILRMGMITKMITLFVSLLIVHFLYDFHIQGDFVGILKSNSKLIMFIHCLTYALVMLIPFYLFSTVTPLIFFILLSSHLLIDNIKVSVTKNQKITTEEIIDNKSLKAVKYYKYIFLDQIAHIIIILILLFFV